MSERSEGIEDAEMLDLTVKGCVRGRNRECYKERHKMGKVIWSADDSKTWNTWNLDTDRRHRCFRVHVSQDTADLRNDDVPVSSPLLRSGQKTLSIPSKGPEGCAGPICVAQH